MPSQKKKRLSWKIEMLCDYIYTTISEWWYLVLSRVKGLRDRIGQWELNVPENGWKKKNTNACYDEIVLYLYCSGNHRNLDMNKID